MDPHRAAGLRGSTADQPYPWIHGAWAALVLVSLLLVGGVGGATGPTHSDRSVPQGPGGVVGAVPSIASSSTSGVHWGHPTDLGTVRASLAHGPTPQTSSPCTSWLNNTVIGEFGISFTLTTTPANLSGPAPLNVSWNLTVYGGGLPPYRAYVLVYGSGWSNLSTDLVGTISVPTEGLYAMDADVFDATCTQVGGVFGLPVMAWGALGPHPFTVSASPLRGTVPAPIHYAANTSRLPSNWSVLWTTPYLYSNVSWVDHTYYAPGEYNATACFVEPNQNLYACATSPTVAINGTSVLQVGASVAPGAGPVNVTFYANLTNASLVPNGTEMYLYAWNGTVGAWLYSNTTTIALTESVGCGTPWTQYVPLSGNCTWTATASLIDPDGAVDNGFLTLTEIRANVSANASLGPYYPSGTFSYGPTNGTAPLNLSLNFSITGGLGPYRYYYDVFGRSSVFANGTNYPTLGGSSSVHGAPSVWNGSTVSVVVPLNATGVYWGEVFLTDDLSGFLTFEVPLFYVGNVTIYVPVPLHVTGSSTVTSSGVGATIVQFAAVVQGGVGPFTVQWSFGDGTFGSSVVGVPITHTYLQPGRYQPTVTITDARGAVVTESLPPVTVAKAIVPLPTTAYHGAPSWGSWLFGAVAAVAVGLCMTVWFVVRRGERTEAEALVADLERSCEPGRQGPDP